MSSNQASLGMYLYGSDSPPAESIRLRAGPIQLQYEAGDLRYLCFEGREVLRRIYAAVRDFNWLTIAGRLTDEKINVESDQFQISYISIHEKDAVRFEWRARISGFPDGRIA